MDLLCCHKSGRVKSTESCRVELSGRPSFPGGEADEVPPPDCDVILHICKADLPQNGGLVGSAHLYVVVKWDGDTSLCEWEVASTPTLWLSDVAPEWGHGCPRQPGAALRRDGGARVAFEVWQESFFFGTSDRLGAAVVPAGQLAEGALQAGGPAEQQELQLWNDEEDVGSITIEIVPVQSELYASTEDAYSHTWPVDVDSSGESGKDSDQPSLDRPSRTRSTSGRQRAATAGFSRRRGLSSASTSSSSPSSESEGENRSPAQTVASAMMSHWGKPAGQAQLHRFRSKSDSLQCSAKAAGLAEKAAKVHSELRAKEVLSPVKVDAELRAKEILDSVKAHSARELKCNKEARQPAARPREDEPAKEKRQPIKLREDELLKALIKRLRVTAKKYPRNGISLDFLCKERFFAVARDEQNKAAAQAGVEELVLAWFEDKAAWQRRARPLGTIPLASVVSATVDQQSRSFVVRVSFWEDEEDQRSMLDPASLCVIFGSLQAAEEWSKDLNKLVGLVQEAGA